MGTNVLHRGLLEETASSSNVVPGIGLLQETGGSSAVALTVNNAAHAHTAEQTTLTIPSVDSVTLTDVTNLRVFQRSGTSKSITVTGSYTYASSPPTYIQARVVQDGTSTEVVTWTTLSAATISGGSFSGTLSVPQGGWYNLQVRFNNSATVSNGTNKWGVGILVLCVGQSNMQNWFNTGTLTTNPLSSKQSGSSYGNNTGSWATIGNVAAGANTFADALIDQYNIPVGMLSYAAGGTVIAQWDGSGDAYPRDAIQGVTDSGGAVEYILWAQGEGDALAGTAQATYETGLTNCITNFRNQITNGSSKTNLPFLLTIIGRGTAGSLGSDANVEAIRAAQKAVAGSVADVYIACTALDLPIADEGGGNYAVHYTAAGYTTMAQRYAQTVKFLLGDQTYYRGPYVASAYAVDSTHTDITIAHRGGSDFTPTGTTDATGFEIDDGAIVVPSQARRQSATVIRLTHTAVSASATVRYGYGLDGGQTHASAYPNPVADTTAMTLPLEQFSGLDISDALPITANGITGSAPVLGQPTLSFASATVTLVNESNAPQTGLSSLKWAWFDQVTPDLFVAPTDKGSAESTDGSGALTISMPNSTKTSGQIGWLVVTNSDGTTTQSPAHRAFSGPVAVS